MLTVGLYDFYLDEWHANNYPSFFREEAKKRNCQINLLAFAETEKPGGLTNAQWSKNINCQLCHSLDELASKSDAFALLAPSYPQHHERMAQTLFETGKPVYIDKVFAPDVVTAIQIFNNAEKYKAPLFSSSALRFSEEIREVRERFNPNIEWVSTMGPNNFEVYAIHQIEMIQTVMHTRAQRVKAYGNNGGRNLIFDFGDKKANMLQMNTLPFQIAIADNKSCKYQKIESAFFNNMIRDIYDFFVTGKPPVNRQDTLDVISMLTASHEALKRQDEWISIQSS